MPFELIRAHTYPHVTDVLVTSVPRSGSVLFGPKVGSAKFYIVHDNRAHHEIRVVRPAWKGGNHREAHALKRCYLKALDMAVFNGCATVCLNLLAAGEPGFPRPLDLQVALDSIREFLATHELQIYLLTGPDPTPGTGPRHDGLAQFLGQHYREETAQTRQSHRFGPPETQQSVWRQVTDEDGNTHLEHMPPPEGPKTGWGSRGDFRTYLPSMSPGQIPPDESSQPHQAPSCPAPPPPAPKSRRSMDTGALPHIPRPASSHLPGLDDLLQKTDAGFSDTLLKLIDASGKKDSEIYTRANVSRQHFSKIRNRPDYRPTKATAIAFAIALELDMAQTMDLIGRAGYALTNSSKFDVIIMYFIQQKHYDIYDINSALFEYDQSLLGA